MEKDLEKEIEKVTSSIEHALSFDINEPRELADNYLNCINDGLTWSLSPPSPFHQNMYWDKYFLLIQEAPETSAEEKKILEDIKKAKSRITLTPLNAIRKSLSDQSILFLKTQYSKERIGLIIFVLIDFKSILRDYEEAKQFLEQIMPTKKDFNKYKEKLDYYREKTLPNNNFPAQLFKSLPSFIGFEIDRLNQKYKTVEMTPTRAIHLYRLFKDNRFNNIKLDEPANLLEGFLKSKDPLTSGRLGKLNPLIYITLLSFYIPKYPANRPPKNIFLTTLVIIIYQLMKQESIDETELQIQTADIINEAFGFSNKDDSFIKPKTVENTINKYLI